MGYIKRVLSTLFPESIFPRRLSPAGERRLRLARARADEAVVRAHVENALMFVDALAEEVSFDRAIDTYIREMGVSEPLGTTVATRALVALGQDLVHNRKRRDSDPGIAGDEDSTRPMLRLSDTDPRRTSRRA